MRARLMLSAVCLGALAACQPNLQSNNYSVAGTQQAVRAERATVLTYRIVDVQGRETGGGALAGAAIGGVGGSAIGQGTRANVLGALGGAVIGGLAGHFAEKGLSDTQAYEYTLRDEHGQTLILAQQDQTPFNPGARVLIVYGNPNRVIADTNPY